MNLYKGRHGIWNLSLKDMSEMIQSSTGRDFKEKHFRQFLTIVPEFYTHKWQMRKGKMELLIEVPENIEEIIANYRTEHDIKCMESAYPKQLSESILKERQTILREKMFFETYKCYIKAKEELREENEDVYNDLMLDDNDEDMVTWPDFFEPDSHIQKVPKASIKPMPKTQKFETVKDYINRFDIRNQLEKEMSQGVLEQNDRLSEPRMARSQSAHFPGTGPVSERGNESILEMEDDS